MAAAASVEYIDDPSRAAVVAQTASSTWAQNDPVSAARWAERLQDERIRNVALSGVARQWAHEDAERASDWVLTLPEGRGRDAALGVILAPISAKRMPDRQLLDAFESDTARQQAIVTAMYQLAGRDRAAVERLIRQYLTDPTMRARAEEILLSRIH